jgi:malonyl CoA-acyl carrier protein transacylase
VLLVARNTLHLWLVFPQQVMQPPNLCCMRACIQHESAALQVTSPVQWETTLKTLLDKGLEKSYEIGPNKVIAGIMKRISKTSPITNVTV